VEECVVNVWCTCILVTCSTCDKPCNTRHITFHTQVTQISRRGTLVMAVVRSWMGSWYRHRVYGRVYPPTSYALNRVPFFARRSPVAPHCV
jgi:hypothetical protein